jgi:DNA repair exonuclease SbcCD ATPase subunit
MTETMAKPLREQPDIRKLLDLFRSAGQQPGEYETLLDYVEKAENRYNSILDELTALREKVSGIADRKHPLSVMVERLSALVTGIGAKLNALKENIVEFARNALQSTHDKGLSAIGRASEVLHLKNGLQAVSTGLEKAAAKMENLEQFHQEYKTAREENAALPPPAEESPSLSELMADVRVDFENLTPEGLNATYDALLAIGMDNDLTTNELNCLYALTEEVETMLPERNETMQVQEFELAEELDAEI